MRVPFPEDRTDAVEMLDVLLESMYMLQASNRRSSQRILLRKVIRGLRAVRKDLRQRKSFDFQSLMLNTSVGTALRELLHAAWNFFQGKGHGN